MVFSSEFKRAFAVGFVSAATASVGIFRFARWGDDRYDARAILKAMPVHLSGQKSLAATFNTQIEVNMPEPIR
jgi:hypothetical protein